MPTALNRGMAVVAFAVGLVCTQASAAPPNSPNVSLHATSETPCDGDAVMLHVMVTHSITGDPVTCGTVVVQRWQGKKWVDVASGGLDSNGEFGLDLGTFFLGDCDTYRARFRKAGPCPYMHADSYAVAVCATCCEGGSCLGNCGSGTCGCYCDETCHEFGDCCEDVCEVCDLPGCLSCAGSCGGQAPGECFCDDVCFFFGDCCDDICEHCVFEDCDMSD